MNRPWTGAVGTGSSRYKPAEVEQVLAGLKSHVGRKNAVSLNDFCARVRVHPRTVRSILSDYDGVEFVLYQQGEGLMYVAEFQDDTEGTTRQHLSRARALWARARRRLHMASKLPRRQGRLL